jgi:hypothetical protein
MAINAKQSLSGDIAGRGSLTGDIAGRGSLTGELWISTSTDGATEQYTGDYEVTPRTIKQTLPTKKKVMIEDLTVKKIPFFDVSNDAGGVTVYIGEEIEIYGN